MIGDREVVIKSLSRAGMAKSSGSGKAEAMVLLEASLLVNTERQVGLTSVPYDLNHPILSIFYSFDLSILSSLSILRLISLVLVLYMPGRCSGCLGLESESLLLLVRMVGSGQGLEWSSQRCYRGHGR